MKAVLSGHLPAGRGARTEEAWELLFELRPEVDEYGQRTLSDEARQHARSLGLSDGSPAQIGHTYALRTLMNEESDEIIVFTTIDADEAGHTLAWKILESFPTR